MIIDTEKFKLYTEKEYYNKWLIWLNKQNRKEKILNIINEQSTENMEN